MKDFIENVSLEVIHMNAEWAVTGKDWDQENTWAALG